MIEALDAERRGVARAFGHDLPSLAQEMAAVGTADAAAAARHDTRAALVAEGPNSAIPGPDSLRHRYYVEDFAYGLVPFRALAAIAEVSTPVADALTQLGAVLTGQDFAQDGLTAEKLGIAGMSRNQVLALVHGTAVGSAAA
jgi:opine dehydrogenase